MSNNRRLLETWATTVEIMFAIERYRDLYNQPDYEYEKKYDGIPNTGNSQYQTIAEENHYTSAGYDMIDNFNQRSDYGNAYPADRVSGYSITQLENALINAKSWWQWKDNIKNHYNNPSEQYLNELFNNWPN